MSKLSIATKGVIAALPMPPVPDEDMLERQLREELLSALNHDLRSPLGAIGIFCEILLLTPAELDDNQRQSLAMIQEANAKAQRILDDASELTAIYKGTVTLRQESASLRHLVDESVAKVVDTFRNKGIQVAIQGSPDVQILTDPEKTEQILLRVFEEAAAWCSRQGTLKLEIQERSGKAELAVDVECQQPDPDAAVKRPGPGSVKGRLGVRKANESRYSLTACEKVSTLMGASFQCKTGYPFSARLHFPTSSR